MDKSKHITIISNRKKIVLSAATILYVIMNDKNADELVSKEDVDGGLIGGASLVAEKFSAIVKAASNG